MATKFDPTKGTSANQKSRTPAYISRIKAKVRRPAYHHDDQQTDERMKAPPVRKPGESLGAGKQQPVMGNNGNRDLPSPLQKKPAKKRVLPTPSGW
jgi:hypothetical protein